MVTIPDLRLESYLRIQDKLLSFWADYSIADFYIFGLTCAKYW